MKIFHCDHCEQLVFFENSRCLSCDHALAYLSDLNDIGSMTPTGDGLWMRSTPVVERQIGGYRLCANYVEHDVCNWAIPAQDPNTLCLSCRLTRVIPDVERPDHKLAWYRLESAKRRLVYGLMRLGLSPVDKSVDPQGGLAFDFLADPEDPAVPRVMTGHAGGVITINLAEADDAERERRRIELNEPYRTLLGHLRHESGHYYWDRLVRDTERLAGFRRLFGDEREKYDAALRRHYDEGPPSEWQKQFVSAYASMHAWEDWAETWAHYLHMVDTLETAAACGVALRPLRRDEPSLKVADEKLLDSFDRMIDAWFPLTYLLNNLNRGLGRPDGYPFVLMPPVVEKLRFVHETIDADE